MVARVKNYKAGFVTSDSNITPDMTLAQVLELALKEQYRPLHRCRSPTTEAANGKLSSASSPSRDYRLSRMSHGRPRWPDFMTPCEKLDRRLLRCDTSSEGRQRSSSGITS